MSEIPSQNEKYTSAVAEHFEVERVLWGTQDQPFIVRFFGKLKGDSLISHRALSKALAAERISVYFLEEGDEQVVMLVEGRPKPRRSNPLVNLVLFVLTLISMLFAGTLYTYQGPEPGSTLELLQLVGANLLDGMPFAASLLGILLAHEFGHYLAGRYHKTAVTLPYFLPFPFSPFGTLGAFIQLKEPPRNKRQLLDIGIAGPLAGLVVAIPVLLLGLSLSELDTLPTLVRAGEGFTLEGNSILYLASKFLIFREWLPTPASYGDLSPLLYWLRYLFTGLPTPLGGTDVFLHPVAWAGWAGLLVTALNLIPAGQLDGGHVLYGLFGRRARLILPFILLSLGVLGFFWSGWWLWVFLILFMGGSHAQPLDQITKLNSGRRLLAIFALILFVLIFTPIPLRVVAGPYFGP